MKNIKQLCSFCGKDKEEVSALFAGPNNMVYICNECVELCYGISAENKDEYEKELSKDILTPNQMISKMNETVIGQDDLKKKLAVAIYNHQKMIKNPSSVAIDKSNVFIVGPTGSGKTLTIKTIAKELGIPLAIISATSITEAGYVGNDVETVLTSLYNKADNDLELAQKGIVYIDEIDKIGRKGENPSLTRDVSGEGVQQSLLTIVEGCIASFPANGGRKHPGGNNIEMDTSNILFIIGGSFEGIEKLIANRVQGKSNIGFGAKSINKNKIEFNDFIEKTTTEDLRKFGMLPEFLGRFPLIATLKELDEEALIRILTEPKDAIIKQYKELFRMDNVTLEFEEEALTAIARQAIERKTGARGLRGIMDEILFDLMTKLPELNIDKILIKEKHVKNPRTINEDLQ